MSGGKNFVSEKKKFVSLLEEIRVHLKAEDFSVKTGKRRHSCLIRRSLCLCFEEVRVSKKGEIHGLALINR